MNPVMAARSQVVDMHPTHPQLAPRCTLLQQRRVSHSLATPLSVARRGFSVQITAHGTGAATASAHGKRARPGERKGECDTALSPRA
jgi:hypothetical protein